VTPEKNADLAGEWSSVVMGMALTNQLKANAS
jgi:hypothetical protein